MIKRLPFSLTVLIFFVVLLGYSQSSEVFSDPEVALGDYHKFPRESLYMHLNKSSYVEGEEIWFSGYVYNRQSGTPFTKTTNIHVGVYDSAGNKKSNYLYLAREGYFKGNVAVDSTFVPGEYYIKASTKWMQNFKEDDSYVQKIKVVDPSKLPKEEEAEVALDYDVQFLPEGGNLIAGIYNNVGVKVLNDKGYGVAFKNIAVFDSGDNAITQFGTSQMGMGKFELRPELGTRYRAKMTLSNGKVQWYDLPMALPKGINIRLQQNARQDKIGVILAMNAQTYNEVGGELFYFLLHKEGRAKKVPVVFDENDYSSSFFIKTEDLQTGVNTITLFNENSGNTPILERLFFVSEGLQRTEPGIQMVSRAPDSLQVSFTSTAEDLKLSVSVLPSGTLAYNHQDNILSNFYLKPYVRGFVENPRYYFVEQTKKKEYELDLLLLTQGWSRYRWQDVQQGAPKQLHPFEDGIVLRGSVNGLNPKFNGQLLLHNSKYHGQQLLPITAAENGFMVTSFFPENGERLYFTLLNERGNASKPGIFPRLLNNPINDKLVRFWEDPFKVEVNEAPSDNITITRELIGDKTIQLQEVVVSDERIDRNSAKENVFVPMFLKDKLTEVDERMVRDNLFFLDYLRNFYYIRDEADGQVVLRSRRGQSSFTSGVGVNLFFDDVLQPNANILFNLPMGQIESFWIDRNSRYLGARAAGNETLYVYSTRGKEIRPYGSPEVINAYEMIVETGFVKPDAFYMPKYTTFDNPTFDHLGIIHWEPEVTITKNGIASFNILNTGKEEVVLFVEGMSKDGQLVSFSKTLNSNPKP